MLLPVQGQCFQECISRRGIAKHDCKLAGTMQQPSLSKILAAHRPGPASLPHRSSATVEAKAAQAARQAQKRGQQELEAEQEAEARADRVLAHKAFPRMDPSMDGTQQIWDQKIRRIAVRLEISRRKARRIVKCQACDEQMEFCSHPRCLQVLQGSCPCGECDGHPHEDLPM
jgi:hypothetical protein